MAARRQHIARLRPWILVWLAFVMATCHAADTDRWVLFVTGQPSGNMDADLTGERSLGSCIALGQPGVSRIDLSFELPSVPKPAYLYIDEMTAGTTATGVLIEMSVNGSSVEQFAMHLPEFESTAAEVSDLLRVGPNTVSYRVLPESPPGEVRIRGFLLTESADPSVPAQQMTQDSGRKRLVSRILKGLAIAAVVFMLPLLLGGRIFGKLYADSDRFARANGAWAIALATFALGYSYAYVRHALIFTALFTLFVYFYGFWVLFGRRRLTAGGRHR